MAKAGDITRCDKCGKEFDENKTRNNGYVFHFGSIIGFCCAECQDLIYKDNLDGLV